MQKTEDIIDDPMDVDVVQQQDVLKLSVGHLEFWIPQRLIRYSAVLQNQVQDIAGGGQELFIVFDQENAALDKLCVPKVIDYIKFMDKHQLKVTWDKPDEVQLQLEEKHRFPFFGNVTTPELCRIIYLANYLEIEMFFASGTRFFVQRNILDKTPKEIRATLGIPEPDFTDKQRASMKKNKEVFRDISI